MAAVGSAVYLLFRRAARKSIDAFFDRQLEKFRSELQSDRERSLEELRASLGNASFEHQTRFQRLHERRADAIERLYRTIISAERAMEARIANSSYKGVADGSSVAIAIGMLQSTFEANRIFLGADTVQQIDKYLLDLKKIDEDLFFFVLAENPEGQPYPVSATEQKAFQEALAGVSTLRQGLEARFRTMLGIKSGDP
jgi:hypothetical protein